MITGAIRIRSLAMPPSALRVAVGLEEGPGGATNVHGFTIPGCRSSGPTKEEALASFEGELASWLSFLAANGLGVWSPGQDLEIQVDEWLLTDVAVAAGETDVCFEADRVTLAESELSRGVQLLGLLRGRLLSGIRGRRNAELEARGESDLNVRIVLDELARAQWWTLTRLGSSPLGRIPEEVVARLDTAMALAVHQLTSLPSEARAGVIELEGEEWTPRKVLRRLLWLEWEVGGTALRLLDLDREVGR